MQVKLLPLLLLLSLAAANNNMTITCQQCNNSLCFYFDGGPFNNYLYVSNTNLSCMAAGDFPYTYNFTCKSRCADCLISIAGFNQMPGDYCSESAAGDILFKGLNNLYSILMGKADLSQTYDWCNCGDGGLSGGAIAGIVLGSLAGLVLILGCYYYYCYKKKSYRMDEAAAKGMDSTIRKSIVPTL